MLRCHSPALINNARVPCRSEKSSLSPPRTRRLITTFIPRNLSLGTPPHCQAEVASAQERGSGNLCLPVRGGVGGAGEATPLLANAIPREESPGERQPPARQEGRLLPGSEAAQSAARERSPIAIVSKQHARTQAFTFFLPAVR